MFEVVENAEGTYQFSIGNFSGSFTVVTPEVVVPPKPAEFTVTDLKVEPSVTQMGKPVTVTVKVANIGEESGSHTVNLKINDQTITSQTVILSGGETTTVTFTATEYSNGYYQVDVEGLHGSFNVQEAVRFSLFGVVVSPTEAWPEKPVTYRLTVSNTGIAAGSLELKLKVDGNVIETRTVDINGGSYQDVHV